MHIIILICIYGGVVVQKRLVQLDKLPTVIKFPYHKFSNFITIFSNFITIFLLYPALKHATNIPHLSLHITFSPLSYPLVPYNLIKLYLIPISDLPTCKHIFK